MKERLGNNSVQFYREKIKAAHPKLRKRDGLCYCGGR